MEGHINRLKTLKRQMFGRASLDLLQRRLMLCKDSAKAGAASLGDPLNTVLAHVLGCCVPARCREPEQGAGTRQRLPRLHSRITKSGQEPEWVFAIFSKDEKTAMLFTNRLE